MGDEEVEDGVKRRKVGDEMGVIWSGGGGEGGRMGRLGRSRGRGGEG